MKSSHIFKFYANREKTNLQVLSMPLSPVDTLESNISFGDEIQELKSRMSWGTFILLVITYI